MISFINDKRLTCCPALWALSGHFYHKGSVWVRNYRNWQHQRGMQELVWRNVCNALQEAHISNQNDLDPLAVQWKAEISRRLAGCSCQWLDPLPCHSEDEKFDRDGSRTHPLHTWKATSRSHTSPQAIRT